MPLLDRQVFIFVKSFKKAPHIVSGINNLIAQKMETFHWQNGPNLNPPNADSYEAQVVSGV